MSTPEGKVKIWIDKKMKEWFPDAWRYCPPGVGRFGSNGTPDRIYLYQGIFIAIEAKADPDDTATDLQMKRLKEIKKNGGVAAVIAGKDLRKMEIIREEVNRRIGSLYRGDYIWVEALKRNNPTE